MMALSIFVCSLLQGVGDHNEADLLPMFESDMDTLSYFLGEKPFLTGTWLTKKLKAYLNDVFLYLFLWLCFLPYSRLMYGLVDAHLN